MAELYGYPIVCSRCGLEMPEECRCCSKKRRQRKVEKVTRLIEQGRRETQRLLGIDLDDVEQQIRDDWFNGHLNERKYKKALADLEAERQLRRLVARN